MQKRPHLAAAFADQGDDIDVRLRSLGDFAQQRAFTDAAAGEDADALAAAAGQQRVDGPKTGNERFANAGAVERRRRGAIDRPWHVIAKRPLGVDRPAQRIHDAPQHALPRRAE